MTANNITDHIIVWKNPNMNRNAHQHTPRPVQRNKLPMFILLAPLTIIYNLSYDTIYG